MANLTEHQKIVRKIVRQLERAVLLDGQRLTVKRAKELCRAQFSRLPRAGYESLIVLDTVPVRGLYSNFPNAEYLCPRSVYLQNNGGSFRVWEYISPIPIP